MVTGSTAYDLLLGYDGSFSDGIELEALDNLSLGFVTPSLARHHGGTGANIAWNLHLLGGNPILISTVGNDGGEYLALLEERGIDISRIEQLDDYMTSTAIIGTDSDERQITFFHPGADAHGSWPDMSDDRGDISYGIVSPRDVQLMMKAAHWCKHAGVSYIFDPGQQVLSFGDDELIDAIKGSAAVIANEYEWSLLQDRLTVTEENMIRYSPLLIVTRGESGATIFDEHGAETISACTPKKLVNPTGAGDGFRAGLLVGLSNGWDTRNALRLGSAMASFVVECEGPLIDQLDKEEAWSRAEQTFGEKLPVVK